MSFGNTVKDGSGNHYWLLVDSDGRLIINDVWAPTLEEDEGGGNDVEITVTAGEYWILNSILIEYTSDGTAGNRQLVVEIYDSADDIIFEFRVGAVQPASKTYNYALGPDLPDMTAFRDTTFLSSPFPRLKLAAGWAVHVYDNAGISASDAMEVHLLTEQRDS